MESSYEHLIDLEKEELDLRNEKSISSLGYYKDFETIDWLKDLNRDRERHKDINRNKETLWSQFYSIFDSVSGWLCVLLVGLCTGLTAAVVDIGSIWMFDLKIGICKESFWLSKEQCCWISNISNFNDPDCDKWYSWSRIFMGELKPYGSYFLDYSIFILWALFFSWLAVRFIIDFAPYACGSGIPEIKTILGGFIIQGYLGKWTLLIKSIGMILAFSAGLCLGKEGPMIHMAVCWGSIISNLFPKYGNNEAKKREILSAAAGAGVAVAFGSPIGGVLFSLEEASYYFPLKTMFRSFFCAMVAANVVRIMNPYGNENVVMFNLDYKAQWHAIELFPFAILGVLGGIFGVIFNKVNIWVCSQRKTSKLGKFPCIEVLSVTLLTAIISFPQIYMRINSNELISLMVSQCGAGENIILCDYKTNIENLINNSFGNIEAGSALVTGLGMLGLALICKIVLSIYSFGIKVPCGLFIPSLTVGALMGRMMGIVVEQIAVRHKDAYWLQQMCQSNEPCINPGLYAIVGAAACLGGVTRITVSLVVIMMEVTGGSSYILPLMVATMFSKWTGDRFTHTIYDEHIMLNNYPFLKIENQFMNNAIAADVMNPNTIENPLQVVTKDSTTVRQIHNLIRNSTIYGFPVVESYASHKLVGVVRKYDLECAIKNIPATDFHCIVIFSDNSTTELTKLALRNINLKNILDSSPIIVMYQTPIETVYDFFVKLGLRQILVTQNGDLKGIITKKDILMYQKVLLNSKLKVKCCF